MPTRMTSTKKILEIKEKMVEEERKKVLHTGYAPAQNWHSSLQGSPVTNPASPATAPSGPTATATAQQAATATVPIASPDNTDSQQNSATPFQSHTAEIHPLNRLRCLSLHISRRSMTMVPFWRHRLPSLLLLTNWNATCCFI